MVINKNSSWDYNFLKQIFKRINTQTKLNSYKFLIFKGLTNKSNKIPFLLLELDRNYDTIITCVGGGLTGQAEAIKWIKTSEF